LTETMTEGCTCGCGTAEVLEAPAPTVAGDTCNCGCGGSKDPQAEATIPKTA